MKNIRVFSILAILLLLLQSFGINPDVNVSAKSSDDSQKIELKHVATDDKNGEITWKININPSKSASEGFDVKVLFDSEMTHQGIDYTDLVKVKKENDGYSIETPESEETYEIKLITKSTNEEQSQFQLQAIAKEGNKTYKAQDEVEVKVEKEEPEKEKAAVQSEEKQKEIVDEKQETKTPKTSSEKKLKESKENPKKKDDDKDEAVELEDEYEPVEQYGDVTQQKVRKFSSHNSRKITSLSADETTATHKIEKTTSDNICIREVEGTIDFTLAAPETKKPVDIVVVQDASGSYGGNANQAKQSLRDIVEMLDLSQDRMMVTSYRGYNGWNSYNSLNDFDNGNVRSTKGISSSEQTLTLKNHTGLSSDAQSLKSGISQITFDGATPTASGLQYAKEQYQSATAGQNLADRETIFILITDGVANAMLNGRIHIKHNDGGFLYSHSWTERYQYYERTFSEVLDVAIGIKSEGYTMVSAYWENKTILRQGYPNYDSTIGPAARQTVQNAASSPSLYNDNEDLAQAMSDLLANLQTVLNKYNGFQTEFEIAPGFELVENSVYLNGTQVTPTVTGNKVTITASEIPSGDNKITYQLKETAVHADTTTPITNGEIHYDKEGNTFNGSVEIPEVTLAGNENSDRCKVNIDKWISFADSEDFTSSIDLDEENEAFTYKLAYQFDEGVSQYDTVQLRDELESVLELVGDENDITVASNNIQNLSFQVNLLADKGGFTIDIEKHNGSYDYLAGNKITVHFQAKFKEGVTQAELNNYTDQRVPNITSLILDGEPTTSEEVFVKPPSKGKIKIIKVDESNGNRLENAKFNVKDEDGKKVDTLVTDNNGEATSKSLPIGNYTLEEVEAPEGYELAEGQNLSVSVEADKTTNITVTNIRLQGTIKLIKKDEDDGSKLEGAEFEVKDEEGKVVDTLITDANGEATSELLPIGKYTLEEVKAPYGYEITANQDLKVTVEANKVIEIYVTNKQLKGSIQIIKVDAEDNQVKLKGAEFKLTDEDGNTWSGITNDNGEYVFEDLVVGKYELKEIKAPEGYRLLKKPIEVEVKPDDLTITKTIENTEQGWEIPLTGGIGTLGFYSIGLIIMTITGFILFRRRQV